MQRQIIKAKIAIVGCGPVGMLGALLMQHFGIDFVAVEKYPSARAHPSAHWINASSKALFRQIPGLIQQLDKHQSQQKWEYYQYFRYVETLFGEELGKTNQFQPNIEAKLKQTEFLFGEKPSHIPQNKLLKIMYGLIKKKQSIIFGQEIIEIMSLYNKVTQRNSFVLMNKKNEKIIQCEYVILCNGASSNLRASLPSSVPSINMQGSQNLKNFINIHFQSQKLAQKINERKVNAMLHFIYNSKMAGILVNHSVSNKKGEFVLQIVNYEPFVDLLHIYTTKQLIGMAFDQTQCTFMWDILNNLEVINAGKWQLSATLATLFYSNGIFLAGDAAHSIPPAGGFGMNTGFHDINELVHTLLLVQGNPKADKQRIFNNFSMHRWEVSLLYLKKAMQNFEITKQIAKQLGLSASITQIFASNSMLKSMISKISQKKPHYMQKIRLKAFAVMYKKQQLQNPGLKLFFDDFDIYAQKPSMLKNIILKANSKFAKIENNQPNNQVQDKQQKQDELQLRYYQTDRPKFYNLYAREWAISLDQINSLFGEVDPANVKFFKADDEKFKHGERLIFSDGSVLVW